LLRVENAPELHPLGVTFIPRVLNENVGSIRFMVDNDGSSPDVRERVPGAVVAVCSMALPLCQRHDRRNQKHLVRYNAPPLSKCP
jgi:hypothetical protein